LSRGLRAGCILFAILLLLGLGVVAGVALDREVFFRFIPPDNVPAGAEEYFRLIAQAWNAVEQQYVDQEAADRQTLTYGAISGMVDALGDTGHSTFLTPEMVQANYQFTQGQFEGIGAYVEMRDDRAVIVAPIDGSPAEAAGLQPGDVILSVDGESTAGMPLTEVVQRITGPAGTEVTLTLLRPATDETLEVTLTRQEIDLENVIWARVPGTRIAHVRVVAFSAGVTDDLRQALTEIREQQLDGLILDLRRNPGGLLSEAVGVTSQFLESGTVLLRRDAQGNVERVAVTEGGLATGLPLVILIDAGSASAAEIVSGALQDAGRAQLVGETTFGTGTVLQQFPLNDGSALLLATEEWLTPDGRVIWHMGIEPDVPVELPPGATPLLPAAETTMTPEQVEATDDAQFLQALDLLLPAP
jgi:carboxyl-terminal processing protease